MTVQVLLPGAEVTVYLIIAEPLSESGAPHDKAATVPGGDTAAATETGLDGTVAGVTEAEAGEAGPLPTALLAVTVILYEVPLFSPVIVHEVAGPATRQVPLPGLAVTV